MSPPIPSDSGARVPATTEMADAAAGPGGGDDAVTNPPPPPLPTCPICMEPWTCNGDHRICCIPCGHVYGRSCLESWLLRCGDDRAKCPQCGEQFEHKLITNLYAPGNLWDGCCRLQEIKTHYESAIREMERVWKSAILEIKEKNESATDKLTAELFKVFTTLVSELEIKHAKQLAEFQEKSREEMDSLCADSEKNLDQIVRMWNEEKATANANLMVMKERMKKMAEEENATATKLIECVELSFPQLSPISNPCASASASAPAPVDSQNNTRQRWNGPYQLTPVPAPPGPSDAASQRRHRGT